MRLLSLRNHTPRPDANEAGERDRTGSPSTSTSARRIAPALLEPLASLQARRAGTEGRQDDEDLREGHNDNLGLARRRSWDQADRPGRPPALQRRSSVDSNHRSAPHVEPFAIHATPPLSGPASASSSPDSKESAGASSSQPSTGRKAWSRFVSTPRLKFGRSGPLLPSDSPATDTAQPSPSSSATPRAAFRRRLSPLATLRPGNGAGPSLTARARDINAPEGVSFPFPTSPSQWGAGAPRVPRPLSPSRFLPVATSAPLSPVPATPAYQLAAFCDFPPFERAPAAPRPAAGPSRAAAPPAIAVEQDDADANGEDVATVEWWVRIATTAYTRPRAPTPRAPPTGGSASGSGSDEWPPRGLTSRFSDWTPTASSVSLASRSSSGSSAQAAENAARAQARLGVRAAALASTLTFELGRQQRRDSFGGGGGCGAQRASTGQPPLLRVGAVG
ncbi:hypothetical protein JCM10450v2_001673 [Rhodotorula kratochvilovae]